MCFTKAPEGVQLALYNNILLKLIYSLSGKKKTWKIYCTPKKRSTILDIYIRRCVKIEACGKRQVENF